jgi:hypothetical protein
MGIYLAEVGQSDQIHNPPIPTEGMHAILSPFSMLPLLGSGREEKRGGVRGA